MDNNQRAAMLAEFLECPQQAAHALAEAMQPRPLQAQEYLSHQVDKQALLWLVLEGTVPLRAGRTCRKTSSFDAL